MSTRHTSSYRTEYEVFAGPSSGVNLVEARRIREPPELKTIVAIFCEEGEKYISEHPADGANVAGVEEGVKRRRSRHTTT